MEGILIALVIAAVAMGYFVGSKRKIGIAWTVFFVLTGGFIFALPVIFSSTKLGTNPRQPSTGSVIFGWILIALGVVGLFGTIAGMNALSEVPARFYERIGQTITMSIFFVGLGIYLLQTNAYNKNFYAGNVYQPPVSPVTPPTPPYNPPTTPNPQTGNTGGQAYTGGHNGGAQGNIVVTPPPTTTTKTPTSKEFDPSKLYGKN